MARRGTSVRELVKLVQSRLGLADDAVLPVLWYFCRAFCLPLRTVLPLREWIGSSDDREINAELMPEIEKTKQKWLEACDGSAARQTLPTARDRIPATGDAAVRDEERP